MATPFTPGLHHVTAFASDAQRNLDFHTKVLGQRLVKVTVNFDDPSTYHTYFADGVGTPGSVLTYFPIPGMHRGTAGSGETAATSFAVPVGSVPFWAGRLKEHNVSTAEGARFGHRLLAFADPDGMAFELIETPGPFPFQDNPLTDVPPEQAIRGFHSVTLRSRRPEETAGVLTSLLGYKAIGAEGERTRYESAAASSAARYIDLLPDNGTHARQGAGSVHHIAFRSSAEDHLKFFQAVTQAGLRITPPQERCYFRSLYFREPGGILFEIATDDPGFLIDETPTTLGSALKLPPWFEKHRAGIEAGLTPLKLPSVSI